MSWIYQEDTKKFLRLSGKKKCMIVDEAGGIRYTIYNNYKLIILMEEVHDDVCNAFTRCT